VLHSDMENSAGHATCLIGYILLNL